MRNHGDRLKFFFSGLVLGLSYYKNPILRILSLGLLVFLISFICFPEIRENDDRFTYRWDDKI